MPKIAHVTKSVSYCFIISNQAPTLGSMKQLGSMKTEGRCIAIIYQGLAVVVNPKGMCSIVNYFQLVLFCDFFNALNIARNSVNMGCKNCRGFGCYKRLNKFWVNS